MNHIKIFRKGLLEPFFLENGDAYDSYITIEDESGKLIERIPFVNTDHTQNYKGGILSPGEYSGVAGKRKNGDKAVWLFRTERDPVTITSPSKLFRSEVLLPSEVGNPNHGGKKQMQWILIHRGGLNWDWSHGCSTVLSHYFDLFQKHIKVGEKFRVTLIDDGATQETLPAWRKIVKAFQALRGAA